VQKSQGGATGKIRQAGTFYVYANVADTGNPSSGISSVSADVSAIATVTSAALSSGSYVIGGVSYGYRSAQLTAKATLATGTYSYAASATDAAGNASSATTASVSVDDTAFGGTDSTTLDVTGNTGLAQTGDQIAFIYNKAPEPSSVLPGWTGASTSVTFRISDGTLSGLAATQDVAVLVDGSGNPLGTGSVALNGDYVATGKTVNFTGSTMTLSNSTISVALGTADVPASLQDDNGNRLPVWAPSATAIDQFANPSATTAVTQSGIAKKQF
jgi:hypothetical protein